MSKEEYNKLWDTEKIIYCEEEWTEEMGEVLWFKMGAGEPPVVSSPLCDGHHRDYYTHFVLLPKCFTTVEEHHKAFVKSGLEYPWVEGLVKSRYSD